MGLSNCFRAVGLFQTFQLADIDVPRDNPTLATVSNQSLSSEEFRRGNPKI
jgi:hypothetical protein